MIRSISQMSRFENDKSEVFSATVARAGVAGHNVR